MLLTILLGVYTVAVIALLTWALTPGMADSAHANTVFRLLEGVIPGGIVVLSLVWLLLFGAVAATAVRDAGRPVLIPATALAILIATYVYVDWWTRAVALPTRGGISPGEAALYFAGGLGAFVVAGFVLLLAVLVNLVRGLPSRNRSHMGTSSSQRRG